MHKASTWFLELVNRGFPTLYIVHTLEEPIDGLLGAVTGSGVLCFLFFLPSVGTKLLKEELEVVGPAVWFRPNRSKKCTPV